MNNKKYSLSLLIVLIGILTHSVTFAESGAKKGSKTQAPVINMPIMVPVKTKALDKKIPLVKAKPRKAIVTPKQLNTLQNNKVTSIKAKPNKVLVRQVKPLTVKRLGKSFGKGPTNVSGENRTIPSSGGMSNVPADRLNHANQAGDLKEMSEMTKDRLGVLNQDSPLDSNLGLGPNDSGGYSFGGREGGNGNGKNGPARIALGPGSVRGAAAGAAGSIIIAPPGAITTASSDTDSSSSATETWTDEDGTQHGLTTVIQFGGGGTTTQSHLVTSGDGVTTVTEASYNSDGSGTETTFKLDSEGNIVSKATTPIPPDQRGEAPPTSPSPASELDDPAPAADSVIETQDPGAEIKGGSGAAVVEQINGIKKDTSIKTHKHVNPGRGPEAGSNSAPKATLFIPKDKLVTNPDPENVRGADAVAGRAMRPEKIMEGAGPGGHIGKGQ